MRRFYAPVSSFTEDGVVLAEDETRHLRDVLRLRPGAEVYVIDGEGMEFRCRVERIDKRTTHLAIIEASAPTAPESPLDLTLAAAVLKGDKFDLVVQKAVELGVRRLVPLVTERGDVKVKDAEKRLERWNRIVLESSKQSGRASLMEVVRPTLFGSLIVSEDSSVIVFSERGGSELPRQLPAESITAVVGPAGGWTDSELESAVSSRAILVTLGGRILRAETAAITAAAILQHRFGDLS